MEAGEQGIPPVVYVVSDSLGETAELVARAAASQFNSGKVDIRRVSYVNDSRAIDEVVQRASCERSIIVHTIILPELRHILQEKARAHKVPAVDVMGPTMDALAMILDVEPRLEPGIIHQLDERYFRRVEAIEFAVKYDDGKDPRGLLRADIVLLGVSRTSKTPVGLYLAHHRFRVANIPLVPEVELPEELFLLDRSRIVGLTINARKLYEIRQERLKSIGLHGPANYGEMDRIRHELEFARRAFQQLDCPVIDVSNKAVEETANEVLELIKKGERR